MKLGFDQARLGSSEAAAIFVKEQVPARETVFVILDPGISIPVHPHELADDVGAAAK